MSQRTRASQPWAGLLALALFVVGCSGAPSTTASGGAPADAASPIAKLTKLSAPVPSAASAERPEDALKSSGVLVTRAQAALRDLRRIAAEATVPPELETLALELPELRDRLKARVAAAKDAIRRSRRTAWVRDIRYAFVEDDRRISAWQAQVTEASAAVTSGRARTAELLAFWRRADELARQTGAPDELRAQASSVVAEALHTELVFARPEAVTIPLELTLSEMREMTEGFLHYVEREGPNLVLDAREHDYSVVAAVRALAGLHDPLGTVRGTTRHMLEMAGLFLTNSGGQVLGHGALFVALILAMLSLRSNSAEWVGDDRPGRIARRVVKHPFAAALLLGAVAGIAIYQAIPTLVLVTIYALAAGAALVLFPSLLDPRLLRSGYVLGGFLLVDLVRLFVIEIVPLERLLLIVELCAACAVLSSMLTQHRWQVSRFAESSPRFYRAVAWCWLAGAGLGAVGALFGYGSLAEILGGGVLVSMYLALIIAAAFAAAEGSVWVLTQDGLLGRLNSVRRYRSELVRSLARLLRWGALLLWLHLSLQYLTLADGAWRAVFGVLNASLELGTLKLSLGDGVVLVLGAVVALNVARLLRFLLEEDVVSRLSLSVSTQQATSLTAYYAVLSLGFFLTLAAAGIELDRLTVLAGALGVGLGFGLQNVVQNFIAGLLLLFGGPIKIGDKIQLGELSGEVQAIGFRASTVRTWQGAEVIVPNSKLIADQVVNWTLSDQKRRVDIDIGVEYGTDPERVIALLKAIGAAHPKVLADPAPTALFVRQGAGSLDFQLLAWSTFDDSGTVKSELTTAINRRLAEEKIGMPIPERDLNLKRIAPEVVSALREAAPKSS